MTIQQRIIVGLLCLVQCFFLSNCFGQEKVNKKAEAWYFEGIRSENMGMIEEALFCYTKAIKKQKTYILPWLAKANILYRIDSLQLAYDVLKKTESCVKTSHIKLDYGLALYSFLLQDYDQAQEHIDKLFKVQHRFSSAFKYEASILQQSIYLADSLVRHPHSYELERLPASVNSSYDEYFPSLTVDGEHLFFTRLKPKEDGLDFWDEDLYSSHREDASWTDAVALPSTINSNKNEGANSISTDGHELFYAAMYGQQGDMNIYRAEFGNQQWNAPKPLSTVVNSSQWDSQPCLSADGTMLFFTSTRPGGLGNSDIYVARRDSNHVFSIVERLPFPINTPSNDQRPHFHPDGKTLYFSSSGLPGMGGSDLYKSQLMEDGTWTKPVNLGFPINSPKDERGIFISGDGKRAFISTNRDGSMGGMDIYQFDLPQSVAPGLTSYLKGAVLDSLTRLPLTATIEIYDLTRNQEYRSVDVDPVDGSFLFALPGSFNYSFHITSPGKIPISKTITSDSILTSGEFLNEEFLLSSPRIGNQFRLNNVFFETNSAVLKEISKQELQIVANWMVTVEDTVIFELQGHTDNRGSEAWNLTLSQQRADAVRDYLISIGIPDDRLIARGFGMTRPVSTNETEEGRAKNRRTEVHFR